MRNLATISFILIVVNSFGQSESQKLCDLGRSQSKKVVTNINSASLVAPIDTATSITEMLYLFGAQESQILEVNHQQRFKSIGTVVLKHLMTSGNGSLLYDNFRTVQSSISSTINRDKLNSQVSLEYFKDGRSLNGGVKNDSAFTNTALSQDFLEVNLSNNSSSYSHFLFKQDLSWLITRKLWLVPSIEYINEDRNYSGNGNSDSSFFSNVYYHENQSVDYYRWRRVNASIGTEIRDSTYQISASITSNNDYYMNRDKLNWLGLGANLTFNRIKATNSLHVKGEYHFSGYRKGGYKAQVRTDFFIDTSHRITADFSTSLLPPKIYQIQYYGNHYKWNYNAIHYPWMNSLGILYHHNRFNFQVNISGTTIKDYFYFDTNMVASQVNNAHFASANIKKDFALGRFKFPVKTTFNFGQSSEIRLPETSVTGGIFVSLKVFKAKLKLDLGGQCNWFSNYFANRFEPSTGITYLQNDKLIGNYPFVDISVSSSIKGASFYFMALHVNENLTGRNYYTRPDYLEIGSRFIFGVKWRFIN
ncbi:putative porin [Flavobacteriales bacterium]|nr:putative porin [Flavobacteriales bacterium]